MSTLDEFCAPYMPLVHSIAADYTRRTPAHATAYDDLVAHGTLGLYEAAERYDAANGATFGQYAHRRIRGAMLDASRSMDWASRLQRRAINALAKAADDLRQELGREPVAREIIARAGLSESHAATAFAAEPPTQIDEAFNDESETTLGATIRAHDDADPAIAYERREGYSLVAIAARVLDEREQVVVELTIQREMTLAAVGQIIGCTESRVCQVRKRALRKLRREIEWAERIDYLAAA